MLYEWERGMELEWEDIQAAKLPAESKRSCKLGWLNTKLTSVPSRAHKTIPTLKEIHLSPVSLRCYQELTFRPRRRTARRASTQLQRKQHPSLRPPDSL